MNKELLRKPWMLALLLLGISIIIGLVFFAIVTLLNIQNRSISALTSIIGAMIVGQIYTFNFKEIMPNKTRRSVTIIYTLIQLVLGILFALILIPELVLDLKILLLVLGGVIIISFIYALGIYWMLGTGGKSYIKMLEKSQLKAK